MSTSVILEVWAVRPPDAAWKKHKAVYDACVSADVDVPKETLAYFNVDFADDGGYEPSDLDNAIDEDGVKIPLACENNHECCETYEAREFGRWVDGCVVDVSKLPEGVRYIKIEGGYS